MPAARALELVVVTAALEACTRRSAGSACALAPARLRRLRRRGDVQRRRQACGTRPVAPGCSGRRSRRDPRRRQSCSVPSPASPPWGPPLLKTVSLSGLAALVIAVDWLRFEEPRPGGERPVVLVALAIAPVLLRPLWLRLVGILVAAGAGSLGRLLALAALDLARWPRLLRPDQFALLTRIPRLLRFPVADQTGVGAAADARRSPHGDFRLHARRRAGRSLRAAPLAGRVHIFFIGAGLAGDTALRRQRAGACGIAILGGCARDSLPMTARPSRLSRAVLPA